MFRRSTTALLQQSFTTPRHSLLRTTSMLATTAAGAGAAASSSSSSAFFSTTNNIISKSLFLTAISNNNSTLSLSPSPQLRTALRFSSTSSTAAARSKLHDQTLSEIKGEESQAGDPEPQLPAGWVMHHDLGTNFFTGTRREGDETISLYCQLRSPRATAAERDAGREDGGAAQPFSVFVARDGNSSAMFASLSVMNGELVVEQIRMLATPGGDGFSAKEILDLHRGSGDKMESLYEGPGIFELEEPFAEPLFHYLEDRGLSDEFGEFVALYAYHTEQREYITWLKRLEGFTN